MARPPGTPQPRARKPVAQSHNRVKLYGYVPREQYEKVRTAAYSCGMSENGHPRSAPLQAPVPEPLPGTETTAA